MPPQAYGDPDDPVTADDLEAKFAGCVAGRPARDVDTLRRAIDDLFDHASVTTLTHALRASNARNSKGSA
jgi:hypothetical protein